MGFRSHNVPQLDQEHAQAPAVGIGSVWPPMSQTLFGLGSWTVLRR